MVIGLYLEAENQVASMEESTYSPEQQEFQPGDATFGDPVENDIAAAQGYKFTRRLWPIQCCGVTATS